ncbi:MAG: Fic family protein [Clostridiales bacterium]|jgi:Fic family protein|nr:Fic family protein [Clostridiales bacterium]
MANSPPYTITLKTADYLSKIVEAATRLELGTDFKRNILLHRKNRLRTIHSSLAIEGNTLSLDEVAAVLDGKLVAGKQEEIKEVKNAYEAYDKIMAFDPYAAKDFLKAHKLMTQGLVKDSGKYRSGDVGVFDGDVAIHLGARPQFAPNLIAELFAWAKESELHAVLKSAIMHYEIEIIHPFADGNGRMGRLWQTLVLAKWNEIFAWVPMETVMQENRPQYYRAIQEAKKANDSGVFIEFTLSALLETLRAQTEQLDEQTYSAAIGAGAFAEKFVENADKFAENADEFVEKYAENETQKSILRLLMARPAISAKKMAEDVGMSSRGVQKSIDALKKQGLVERVGSAKGGHWVVKKPG